MNFTNRQVVHENPSSIPGSNHFLPEKIKLGIYSFVMLLDGFVGI